MLWFLFNLRGKVKIFPFKQWKLSIEHPKNYYEHKNLGKMMNNIQQCVNLSSTFFISLLFTSLKIRAVFVYIVFIDCNFWWLKLIFQRSDIVLVLLFFFSLVVHEHFISFLFYFKDKKNSKTFSTGMFISCCSICYSRFQIEYFWKCCIQMKIAIHSLWMVWYKIAIYGRVVYNKLGMILVVW